MATSTNARFPRPLVVSCNLGLIFVVLDIISVSHNNISLTKISTAFWEKGNNPTCRVDAVQIKQIAPWFHSVDPPSSSCKNHPSTAVIGWPHWVPSLCFLWQLTHTVALVMYIFLEVYFMSFSSAGNADVFGLHIGLLLRHSCHSWLQECLWARRVEQNRHQRCWCVYWSNYSSQSAASPDTHRPFIPGETSAIPDVFMKPLLPFLVCRMYVDKP